eukprot:COSAG06_NODE_60424_length_271_cov_0.569767_1_plen_60_part_01
MCGTCSLSASLLCALCSSRLLCLPTLSPPPAGVAGVAFSAPAPHKAGHVVGALAGAQTLC